MPDQNENLYIFEAIELRKEYDILLRLLENLTSESNAKRGGFLRDNDAEMKEPVSDFKPKELEERLKKIRTKRIKLNQAIQRANFEVQIDYEGDKISIAEALEIRKKLLADRDVLSERVENSAYKRIIHKEERDIVKQPKRSFTESYKDFEDVVRKLRLLITQIHVANHRYTVTFKDE
jgi:hypothetical protein